MEIVSKIAERRMELPGVVIEVQPIRHFVYGNFASHILGYMGEEVPDWVMGSGKRMDTNTRSEIWWDRPVLKWPGNRFKGSRRGHTGRGEFHRTGYQRV